MWPASPAAGFGNRPVRFVQGPLVASFQFAGCGNFCQLFMTGDAGAPAGTAGFSKEKLGTITNSRMATSRTLSMSKTPPSVGSVEVDLIRTPMFWLLAEPEFCRAGTLTEKSLRFGLPGKVVASYVTVEVATGTMPVAFV